MTDVPDSPTVTRPPEHPELLAYRARTKRATVIYAVALLVIILLALVGVKLAYAHGELDKVSFRTAPAPAPVAGAMPGASLTLAWHSADAPAGGDPYSDGIVVTYAGHTVNGRDAVTGAVRWHYTRSDETICSVLQQDSSTIAIYRRKGNCDEVTGFATATGQPKWYRTLTDDGDTVSTSLPNVVMTLNDGVVHAFDNDGGLDRWDWKPPAGCAVQRALAGSLGVLISLDCGATHQLSLHDLIGSDSKWTVQTSAAMVPLTASAFMGAIDPATGQLYTYTAKDGADAPAGRYPELGAASSALPRVQAAVSGSDATGQNQEFVFAGGLVAFGGTAQQLWAAAAASPPTPVSSAFLVTATAAGQVVLRRMSGGQLQLSSSLSPAPATPPAAVFPVGAGVLLTGAGVDLYR
jgi:hypothetical protein